MNKIIKFKMNSKNKWLSAQSIIVLSLIMCIFTYIGYDAFFFKKAINIEISNIKIKQEQVDSLLNKKIPEIDSTLKIHTTKILEQKRALEKMNKQIKP